MTIYASPARFVPSESRKVTVTDQIGQTLFVGALVVYPTSIKSTDGRKRALGTGKVVSKGPTAIRIAVHGGREDSGWADTITKKPWECVRYGEAD